MYHRTIPSKFSCVTVRIGHETLLYMSVSTLVQDGTGCIVGDRKVSKLKLDEDEEGLTIIRNIKSKENIEKHFNSLSLNFYPPLNKLTP